MRFKLAALGPVVRLVVVRHVAEQQAPARSVHDQPDVAVHPHGPEVPVPDLIELVKAQSRLRRIELEVEGRRLDRLLLVAGEAREAIGERVRYAEIHVRRFTP